jgi:hypothetical protein
VGGPTVPPRAPSLVACHSVIKLGLPAGTAGLRPSRCSFPRRYDRSASRSGGTCETRCRATISAGRSGGTGRRAGLKIPCPSGRVGSTPTSGIERSLLRCPVRPHLRHSPLALFDGVRIVAGGRLAGREAPNASLLRRGRGYVGETSFPPTKKIPCPSGRVASTPTSGIAPRPASHAGLRPYYALSLKGG